MSENGEEVPLKDEEVKSEEEEESLEVEAPVEAPVCFFCLKD